LLPVRINVANYTKVIETPAMRLHPNARLAANGGNGAVGGSDAWGSSPGRRARVWGGGAAGAWDLPIYSPMANRDNARLN